MYRARLKNWVRGRGESLTQFAQDVLLCAFSPCGHTRHQQFRHRMIARIIGQFQGMLFDSGYGETLESEALRDLLELQFKLSFYIRYCCSFGLACMAVSSFRHCSTCVDCVRGKIVESVVAERL